MMSTTRTHPATRSRVGARLRALLAGSLCTALWFTGTTGAVAVTPNQTDPNAAYLAAVREAVAAKMRYEAAIRAAVAEKMRRDAQQAAMRAALTAAWMPGGFADPSGGAWIISNPGMRWHPVLGVYRCHGGVDYASGWGRPIYAPAPGTVASTGWGGPPLGADYGNFLLLDHGGGVHTAYAHLSSFSVAPGQAVVRGQVLGYVGATGTVTGPHLHFELRLLGRPHDSRGWVSPANPALRRPAC